MLAQPITDGPHETPNLVKRGIPFISVEAVMNNRLDFTRKRGFISSEYNDQCNKKYKPQLHDVYLVKSGSTVGKVAIVETNMVFNIWSPLAAMRVNEFNNAYFLYYLLQTDNLQDQIKKKSKGGTQPNLSMRILEKCITNSTNLKEETQIALILNKVDKLLLLQQRKLEQLKSIKNGILQEIFPDKDLPNLHLKEYEIHWRQRKLEEITSTITKGTTPLDKSGKGTINFIKVENINPDNNEININSKISKEEHLGRLKRSILQENDILFSIAGTLGRIGIISPDLLPANTNQALAIIRLKEGDLKFVSTVLKGRTVKKYIRQNPTTGAQPNLSLKQVSNLKIPFPSLQEQTQLGKFFEKTDFLIDKQQRIVTQFEQAKLFLLQNMFI